MLNFLRNSLSGLVSFVLVPSIVASLLIFGFANVFLNTDTFTSVLRENNTFVRTSQNVIPSLLVNLVARAGTENRLPPDVIIRVVKNIDKTQLAADLEMLVSNAHSYVIGETESFTTRIEVESYVKSLRENLKPEITSFINSLPVCTAEQEAQLAKSETGQVLSCRPQGKTTEQLLSELEVDKLVDSLAKESPKALVFTEKEVRTDPQIIKLDEINKKPTDNSTLQNLKTAVGNLRSSQTLLLSIVILLAIVLFVSRLPHFASGFKWLSSALFSASIFPLVIGVLLFIYAKPDMLEGPIRSLAGLRENSELESALTSLAADSLAGFAGRLSQSLIFSSIALVFVAIVLYFISFFLQQRAKKGLDVKKPHTP